MRQQKSYLHFENVFIYQINFKLHFSKRIQTTRFFAKKESSSLSTCNLHTEFISKMINLPFLQSEP